MKLKGFISLYILILACLFGESLSAQRFENLIEEFPFLRVREITQDKYGFLWFSTRDGIVRYDGYNYRHYSYGERPEDLNGRYVETIFEDDKGRIWVGMKEGGGLECFDRNSQIFKNWCIKNPSSDTCYEAINVYTIKQDQNGILWVGTDQGRRR